MIVIAIIGLLYFGYKKNGLRQIRYRGFQRPTQADKKARFRERSLYSCLC